MAGINDEALVQEFVVESREHLDSIEPDLLILEKEGQNTDTEIINRIFRAIHSIKGASGFFGFESLKSLSHSMENILMMVRDGKLSPSDRVMEPLLQGVDRLRQMLEDIQASENVSYQDIVTQLDAIANNEPISEQEQAATQTVTSKKASKASSHTVADEMPAVPSNESFLFEIDPKQVESSLQNGQSLYTLTVNFAQDLDAKNRSAQEFCELLGSTGKILASNLDDSAIQGLESCLEKPLQWQLLYATVLDPELAALAFDLPNTQCVLTPKEAYLGTPIETIPAEKTAPNAEAEPDKVLLVEEVSPPKPAANRSSSNGSSGDSNETIRVKVDLLNRLMDLAGELVLARNQLNRRFESQADDSHQMGNIIQNIDLVTSDLQEHIMQTRMQPISTIFGKFPRVVRDLSRHLKKEIELEMSGEEVELDKSILESLSDPLTHLIRNCCDHGMEKPDVREQNGKPRQGTILLKAYQESGHINIAVIDDGAGIDHDKVAKKALNAGIINEATLRQMSVQDQVNLIFKPGFSTAETVTDVSGRGVGMDVVRTNIEQIGGTISVETEIGKGTAILLRLPLTLAIIPSLIVSTADQIFAVPQINLVELVNVTPAQIATRIEKVGSASILRLRGRLLPLVKLSDVLGLTSNYVDEQSGTLQADRRENIADLRQGLDMDSVPLEQRQNPQSGYNILVLKHGSSQYGLIVDVIKDIEEIVVKPLSQFLKNCKCFSGATIMGDGKVAMILDTAGIVSASNLSFTEVQQEEQRRDKNSSIGMEQKSRKNNSILLFASAPEESFAMDLSSILRIEIIKKTAIERVGHQKFLPYNGKSMTLLFLNEHLPVSPIPDDVEDLYVIIPLSTNSRIGIVASKLIDTFEFQSELDPPMLENPGLKGSAVINNHVTLFIDHEGLLKQFTENSLIDRQRSRTWPAEHLQPSH